MTELVVDDSLLLGLRRARVMEDAVTTGLCNEVTDHRYSAEVGGGDANGPATL